MKKRLLFFLSLLWLSTAYAASDITVEVPSEPGIENISAQEFLAMVRAPLREQVWGEITGRMTCKKKDTTLKSDLRVRITFTPESMHAQITQDETNTYVLEQFHKVGEKVTSKIEMPPKEKTPGLFQFGVAPGDLSFSFLYWNYLEELPRQEGYRIFRLASPDDTGTVQVWFHAKHGFPSEAWWFKKGENTPWRKLQLKGAKRHANGLWFVREMRLDGADWKTMVRFDHAELNPIGE